MLEMLRRGAGVVPQPGEAEVGARSVEQRQRTRLRAGTDPQAIGDLIADLEQLVGGKMTRQFGSADVADLDPAILDHVRIGDLAGRTADRNFNIVVADQMLELLDEILAE